MWAPSSTVLNELATLTSPFNWNETLDCRNVYGVPENFFSGENHVPSVYSDSILVPSSPAQLRNHLLPSGQMYAIHPAEKPSQRQRGGQFKCQSRQNLSRSGVGFRRQDRARNRPLPPIVVQDPNNTVAVKRARNTITARNYRQRQIAKLEELETKIRELEADRDHWMALAKEHGAVCELSWAPR